METHATMVIRIPTECQREFTEHWKQLRLADTLPPDVDLHEGEPVDRFDGVSLVEWIIPLLKGLAPVITGALGMLIARKGEVEIRDKGKVLKFRNLTPRQIAEIMEAVKEAEKTK